jgi:hypothetical protein
MEIQMILLHNKNLLTENELYAGVPKSFPERYLKAHIEEIVLIKLGHKKPWQFLEIEEVTPNDNMQAVRS